LKYLVYYACAPTIIAGRNDYLLLTLLRSKTIKAKDYVDSVVFMLNRLLLNSYLNESDALLKYTSPPVSAFGSFNFVR